MNHNSYFIQQPPQPVLKENPGKSTYEWATKETAREHIPKEGKKQKIGEGLGGKSKFKPLKRTTTHSTKEEEVSEVYSMLKVEEIKTLDSNKFDDNRNCGFASNVTYDASMPKISGFFGKWC